MALRSNISFSAWDIGGAAMLSSVSEKVKADSVSGLWSQQSLKNGVYDAAGRERVAITTQGTISGIGLTKKMFYFWLRASLKI